MVDKTVVVRLNAQTGQYQAQMGAAAASTAGFSRSVQASTTSASASVSQFGKVAATVGKITILGIAAGLALSAKAAIDFESSFAGVRKTVEATEPQFTALEGSIRRMATIIPIGVNELNRIAELGGQLGVEVGGLPEFIETIGKIGVTTNLSVEDAALAFARLDNILQLGGKSFDNMGSALVELGNNFAATESEITTFALRIAPIGATIGLTVDEVFALATAFSSVGVPAERGGTAIQKTFIKIADAVKSGGAALEGFAGVAGVTADAFQTLFEEDPARAFQAFIEGLDRINKEGGNVFAVLDQLDLNNQRVIASLLAMANASGVLDDALGSSAEALEDNIALTEEAEKRFETTASKIELAKNQMNELAITVGQKTLPVIGEIADTVGDFAAGLDALPGPLKAILGGLALLTVGAKASKLAFSGLSKVIGRDLVAAMGVAGFAAGALRIAIGGALIAGLFALVDVIVTIGQENSDSKARVDQLTQAFLEQADAATIDAIAITKQQLIAEGYRDALNSLGISVDTFARAVVGEADSLDIVNARLDEARGLSDELLDAEGKRLVQSIESNIEMERSAGRLKELQEKTAALTAVEKLLAQRTGEVNEAREDADLDREIEAEATIIRQHTELRRGLEGSAAGQREWNRELEDSVTILNTTDDNIKDINEALNEYQEGVVEAFVETDEALRKNVVSWDTWADDVEINVDEVIVALNKRLGAEIDFFNFFTTGLGADASPAVREFLELLSAEEKVSFLAQDTAEQERQLAELEDFFDRVEAEVTREFLVVLPKLIEQGGEVLFQSLGEVVEAMLAADETGTTSAIDAWATTIATALSEAEPGLRNDLKKIFGSDFAIQFIAQATGLGEDYIRGLVAGMLAVDVSGPARGIARQVTNAIGDTFDVGSPSKVMMRMGEQVAQGLTLGIEEGLRNFNGVQLSMIGATRHQFGRQAAGMVTTNNQGDRSMVVNVNEPRTNDLSSDLSAGLIGGGVVELMEAR